MQRSAEISACKRYRYALRRTWDVSRPAVLFIGLNPSTADATTEDNTSRVCINYARRWGYGGLLIGNLFAYRSTDPERLYACRDPVGRDNDAWLRRLQEESALVVCAWTRYGGYRDRDQTVLGFLRRPHCLVRLESGYPGHPLYKRCDLRPLPYQR